MKLLNYDYRQLILQNLKSVPTETPIFYTKAQYRLLCKTIRQKHITKQFFDFLLQNLYNQKDWRKLNYSQMYELIYILNHYNHKKEK